MRALCVDIFGILLPRIILFLVTDTIAERSLNNLITVSHDRKINLILSDALFHYFDLYLSLNLSFRFNLNIFKYICSFFFFQPYFPRLCFSKKFYTIIEIISFMIITCKKKKKLNHHGIFHLLIHLFH